MSEEEERKKNNLPVLRVIGLVLLRWVFVTLGVLLDMKTLEDDWYVVIRAYKCTVSERFFCISIYCVSVVSLHTESTDSMICMATGIHEYIQRNGRA